jgi:hypothetical protein
VLSAPVGGPTPPASTKFAALNLSASCFDLQTDLLKKTIRASGKNCVKRRQEYGRRFTYIRFRVLTGLWFGTLLPRLDRSAARVADLVWNCDALRELGKNPFLSPKARNDDRRIGQGTVLRQDNSMRATRPKAG